jgi:DnaJ-domain-containing protein 1
MNWPCERSAANSRVSEGRIAEAQRQLGRLSERRARVADEFARAEATGGETAALAAELERIAQRHAKVAADLEAFRRTRSTFQ